MFLTDGFVKKQKFQKRFEQYLL